MKWINVAKTIFMCSSPTTPGADGYVLDPNNALIDGLRNVEDIALPDSMSHTFLALTDGSYVLSVDGKEELRGEIYQIRDGVITRVNHGNVTFNAWKQTTGDDTDETVYHADSDPDAAPGGCDRG